MGLNWFVTFDLVFSFFFRLCCSFNITMLYICNYCLIEVDSLIRKLFVIQLKCCSKSNAIFNLTSRPWNKWDPQIQPWRFPGINFGKTVSVKLVASDFLSLYVVGFGS